MKINASQVIELAREWVEVYGSQTPGFYGAHLMGGLNYMPTDAPFPIYKDVDVNIVLQDGPEWDVHCISYNGLILEYGVVNAETYRSPEIVLADPSLASNLAVNSVLSDPMGMLALLQSAVEKGYPERKWVLARCDAAKNAARRSLEELGRARSPIEASLHLGFLTLDLGGLIALAGLRPPTHRGSLVLVKEVLETWGRAGLQEEMLSALGCAHFNRTEVDTILQECATVFDIAVEVTRTPIPFGQKLHAYVKPYLVDGAREMIDAGYHREAILWIYAFLWISNTAIQVDGSENQKIPSQMELNQLTSAMGLRSAEDVEARYHRAIELAERIFKAADDIVSQNPEIVG